MTKTLYFFCIAVLFLFFTACEKPTPRQEPAPQPEPGMGTGDTIATATPDTGYVQIINQSGSPDGFVDSAYFSDAGIAGITFPVGKGKTVLTTTANLGKKGLYVETSGGERKSLWVIDGNGQVLFRSNSAPEPKIFQFENIEVSAGDTLKITYQAD